MTGDRALWVGSVTVPNEFFGTHANHWPVGNPTVSTPAYAYQIFRAHDHGSGANISRGVRWANLNPSNGTFDWTNMDELMAAIPSDRAVWYTLCSTPTWAALRTGAAETDVYGINGGKSPPANNANAAAFAVALINRYPGRIKYFELWNEPSYNTAPYALNGFSTFTASEMTAMARVVSAAIRAVAPTIKVLAPSDWSVGLFMTQFLSTSDGAGGFGRDWVDGVVAHPYTRYWHTDTRWPSANEITSYTNAFRANMVTGGVASTFDLYFGEVGYATSPSDSNLLANTPEQLAVWAKRMALGAVANNVKCLLLFEHDNTLSGDPDVNAVVSAAWNDIGQKLAGKTVRQIHYSPDVDAYKVTHANGEFYL